jgi:hypothetical protein
VVSSRVFAVLLTLVLLPLGTACQKNTGVFLSLTTDLTSPSELAQVRLSVKSDDRVRFDNSGSPWQLGPGKSISLPGSLAFYAEQGTPVATFVVDGLNSDGQVIVSRTALLSTVADEMLYLRLSLSRACVSQTYGGSLAESCGDGLTCVEGRCVSPMVDPTSLPVYQSGQDQERIDCEPLQPVVNTSTGQTVGSSATGCPSGNRCQEGLCVADPGCQSGSCACPADKCEAQTLALSAQPGRLALSPERVYYTEITGPTGGGFVRSVPRAGGPITTVAKDLQTPGAIRFQGGQLVFADRGTEGGSDGRIFVQRQEGGDVVLYQEGVPDPTDVWVDDTNVHWLREDGCFKVLALTMPNMPYTTWLCGAGAPHAFGRDATGVFYWLTGDSGVNYSAAVGDGPYTLTGAGNSPWDHGDLLVTHDLVLFTDGTTLWGRTTDPAGQDNTLSTGQQLTSLAVGQDQVFVADGAAGTIVSLPITGGGPMPVLSGLHNPRSLAVDGKVLYFVEDGAAGAGGRIVRLQLP